MDATSQEKAPAPIPALRQDLEILPIEHQGKPMFLLQDHEGLTGKTLGLSPAGMAIASMLDGRHTAADVQSLFTKTTGTLLHLTEISALVDQLGKANLLETPEIQDKRRQILETYLASPVRSAQLKGPGYPENTLELATFLGQFLRDPKGPGKPLSERTTRAKPPIGLISPHIDFRRGGPAYAWAYQALSDCPPPDLIVAVGVAHAGPNAPWVMTRKAYETPYGPMSVSSELYDAIRSELWYNPCEDEWVHRKEHSLEFQAVWLKSLWRDKTPPWAPVLCSAFDRFCPDRPPSSVESIEQAIQKIGRRLRALAEQKSILILAGVDLAHVGPRFGDEIALGPELERKIESEDRVSLEHAMKLEADPFYLSVVADKHWRKVCGLSALYTSLRWIKALGGDQTGPGTLLTYGQAPDPMGGIVSFASGIFY